MKEPYLKRRGLGHNWVFQYNINAELAALLDVNPGVINRSTGTKRIVEARMFRDRQLQRFEELLTGNKTQRYQAYITELKGRPREELEDLETYLDAQVEDYLHAEKTPPDTLWGRVHAVRATLKGETNSTPYTAIQDVYERYETFRRKAGKDYRQARNGMRALVRDGMVDVTKEGLDAISPGMVARWIEDVADEYSQNTIRAYTTGLSGMYKYAARNLELVKLSDNPFRDHEILGRVQEPTIVFSDTFLRTMWQHLEKRHQDALFILRHSGHRPRELELVERISVEGVEAWVGGLKTRAGRGRVVPVHRAIIEQGIDIPEGYRASHLREAVQAARLATGITERVTPRGLRKQFTTLARDAGQDRRLVSYLDGHIQDSSVTSTVYDSRPEISLLVACVNAIPTFRPNESSPSH